MADKYHIGQKVRVIKTDTFPELVGRVFTITGPRKMVTSRKTGKSWLGYSIDQEPITDYRGTWEICPVEEYLEPVYEGDTKSTWSECAWQPKSLVKG